MNSTLLKRASNATAPRGLIDRGEQSGATESCMVAQASRMNFVATEGWLTWKNWSATFTGQENLAKFRLFRGNRRCGARWVAKLSFLGSHYLGLVSYAARPTTGSIFFNSFAICR